PPLAAGTPRYIKVRNASFVDRPLAAEAQVVQITSFNPTATAHFVLYPSDLATPPLASALNAQAGSPQANGAFMALGRRDNDDLAVVYGAGAGATSDFTVDIYGWFAKDALYRYYAVEPCRAGDTRNTIMGGPRL